MDFLERSQAAQLVKTHTLIGFGAGIIGEETQNFLDGKLTYFIDNERLKQEKTFAGVPVRGPETIKGLDPETTAILVCSEQYHRIGDQIQSLNPAVKVYRSPLLKEYATFDRLLNCSQRLLVSAYGAAGGLYLVNGRTEVSVQLASGSFRGLVRVGERLVVGTEKGGLLAIDSLDPFHTTTLYEPDSINQLHGLAWWPKENRLYAAEAEHDSIAVFDADSFSLLDHIPMLPDKDPAQRDACHVNDLHVYRDTLFVSMISRTGWWREGIYDGSVCGINLGRDNSKPRVVLDNLLFPHSIQFIEKTFYVLESMPSNITSGQGRVIMRLNGFIRGLDGHDGILYVGQARNRRVREAVRFQSPLSMDSGVYVIDTETQVYRFIKMPEMCDIYNILDLTRLNVPGVTS